MSIDITKDTKNKINDLVHFIYHSVKIEYVYIFDDDGNKIKYYERSNQWGGHSSASENECEGYSDCEFDDQILIVCRIENP